MLPVAPVHPLSPCCKARLTPKSSQISEPMRPEFLLADSINWVKSIPKNKHRPTGHTSDTICATMIGVSTGAGLLLLLPIHAEPTTMEWNPNLSNSRSEALVLQKDHLGAQVGHDFKSECKNRLISIASGHFYWIKRARRSNRDRIRGVFFKFREAAWIFFVMDVKLL